MNSMSIATHCSLLMSGGQRIVAEINKTARNAETIAQNDAPFSRADVRMPDVNAEVTLPQKDVPEMHDIALDTVFYVTHEGLAEIRSGMSSLSSPAQRVLLMIDGYSNVADLSVRLRGGEAEKILHDLEGAKFIARIGNAVNGERDDEMVGDTNTAMQLSTERLKDIKQKITRDLSERLGKSGDGVLGDVLSTIDGSETALELRAALRKAGDVLIVELGEEGVIAHLRAVGKNVMELIAQDATYSD